MGNNPKVSPKTYNTENLQPGGVIRIETKDANGQTKYMFGKIQGTDIGTQKNKFYLLDA
ncbi:MAG: hypothetical protein H6767_09930 [Candidatus Peribacteria bacterium]|nr:MAG: hypothetical protein H6767_09930 [Candidatus Peribacteria bacterium]